MGVAFLQHHIPTPFCCSYAHLFNSSIIYRTVPYICTRAYVTRREGPRRKAIHYACKYMPVQQSHARQTIAIVPVCKVEQVLNDDCELRIIVAQHCMMSRDC